MRFVAKAKSDGKDILLVGVVSLQNIRGMLVVKYGTDGINTYNECDLLYWEVTLDR